MERIIRKVGLMATLLLAIINARAYDFEVDQLRYDILSKTEMTVKVSGNNGASGSITIPSTVQNESNNYTVVSIGNRAFYGCSALTSVTIPTTVTSIGDWTFYNCGSLTSAEIPSSVTSLGSRAFQNCSNLTSVNIPDGVTSIGTRTFYGCSKLTEIMIPNSVTSIGTSAFEGCSSLTKINIQNAVSSIGANAFFGCVSLKLLTLPKSITSIEANTFFRCASLFSIIIPDAVATIGDGAFKDSGLTSITIPKSVLSIGKDAFFCSNLGEITVETDNTAYTSIDGVLFSKDEKTLIMCPPGRKSSVYIPNTVTTIADNAFSYCDKLPSVTIGTSVSSIGIEAFCYCTHLMPITIPASVTSIGTNAFNCCFQLESIYCESPTPPEAGALGTIPREAKLYVPVGCKEAYEAVEPWKNFENIVEYDFQGIADTTIADDMPRITIKNGILSISGVSNQKPFTIYDMNGRMIYQGYNQLITNLAKGIYILNFGEKILKFAI